MTNKTINITSKLIEDFGGVAIVAEQLGIKTPSVYDWIDRNFIPPRSAVRLFYIAQRCGLKPTLEDLFFYLDEPIVQAHMESSPYKKYYVAA